MSLGTIYSKTMYNFWNNSRPCSNNLSLLLDYQLHIFPMEHGTGRRAFFHSLMFQNWSFFEVSKS